MGDRFLVVMHVLFLPVALVSTMAFIIYTYRMLQEIKPSKHLLANLLPWLALAIPGVLSDAGQRYRTKALLWLIAALVSIGLGFATKTY